jgi:hypothetical protein
LKCCGAFTRGLVSFSILSRFAQASHLHKVRQNLQKAGFLGSWWRRGVVDIPEPISEMCTKEVLVMKFLEGDNLVDGIRALGERAARRQGLTLDDLKRDMLIKFEREGYPEPYAGPSPFVIEAYRYADKVKCALINIGVYLRGGTEYAEPMLDFNPARVMSTLCRVHGHELLKDGLFNGDPSAARRPLYRGLTNTPSPRRVDGVEGSPRACLTSTPPTRCHAGTPGIFYC